MSTATVSRLLLLAAALLFSTGGAAIKLCRLSGWQVASFRSGIAAMVLLLIVPAPQRRWSWRGLAIGTPYAATMILFVLANKLTTAANTIFLQSTAPLYIVLIAPWLLHEPTRHRDLMFMGALAAGLALFFVGTDPVFATAPDPLRGNLIAALSGVAWALTLVGLRWMATTDGTGNATRGGSAGAALVSGNLLAFIACLPASLPVGSSRVADWIVLAYLGCFQIALAYVCVTAGVRHVPALEASLLLLLEPVLNPLWAWSVHGERPGAWSLAGGALILAATAVKIWNEGRRDRVLSPRR
jgi:DME family drug/metabolite transporter